MKNVNCGMFNLPGLYFESGEISDELRVEIDSWCEELHIGILMNEKLISFKNSNERDFFILRFSEHFALSIEDTGN